MNGFKFDNKAEASVTRQREIRNIFNPKGYFTVEHFDKDGNLKNTHTFNNGVTDLGINTALDILFRDAVAKITGWVIGLIDTSGFTAVAAADIMSSHTGWVEFTQYSEANRVPWTTIAAAAKAITNSTPATFNINAGGAENVEGVFIVDQNTKGGTTGTLWATALFSGSIPVTNGDQLKVTYTVTGA